MFGGGFLAITTGRPPVSSMRFLLDGKVQYTSCVDCEAQIDTLRIRCAGGMMQSEATLQMVTWSDFARCFMPKICMTVPDILVWQV